MSTFAQEHCRHTALREAIHLATARHAGMLAERRTMVLAGVDLSHVQRIDARIDAVADEIDRLTVALAVCGEVE